MIPEWAKEMNCAVTVCDKEGVILYMNDKAKETFASHGDLVGKSLIIIDLSRDSSAVLPLEMTEHVLVSLLACTEDNELYSILAELLASGGSNAYTIQKNGLRKMIYQTAWKDNGEVAGLVEISMVIPEDMPHYVR